MVLIAAEGFPPKMVMLQGEKGGAERTLTLEPAGFNSRLTECTSCDFTWSISENALCGTAMEVRGNGATLTNNIVRNNGQNSAHNMWADGITIHFSDNAVVRETR